MNPALGRDYSKYYTQPATAAMLVEISEISEDMTILEPSAGSGAIVNAIRNEWPDNVNIHAVEIKPIVVREHLLYAGADVTICGDFLQVPLEGAEYDRVIANPPFGNETDLSKHWIKMWLCAKVNGLIVSILPADFALDTLCKTYWGSVLESYSLENWGINKDGTVTPIKIIKFRKG